MAFFFGSSPLARGTLYGNVAAPTSRRFIPARAGNTPSASPWKRPGPVHPRSRGEHAHAHYERDHDSGSSPLARGTLPDGWYRCRVDRFIPARAGNTISRRRKINSAPVHPRSRGEHVRSSRWMDRPTGSSPLARGTRARHHGSRRRYRFIPARAGNTSPPANGGTAQPVHPRSRGEHGDRRHPILGENGSSPLARGTRPPGPRPDARSRFIPARAGNTRERTSGHGGSPVHPRSRGEHRGPSGG